MLVEPATAAKYPVTGVAAEVVVDWPGDIDTRPQRGRCAPLIMKSAGQQWRIGYPRGPLDLNRS